MNYLITGAGRGIGRGLARLLLSRGNRVFLVDSNAAELSHTISLAKGWVASTSSPVAAFASAVADLSQRDQLTRAVQEAARFFDSKLDVLINNAFPTPHVWADGRTMEDPDADIEAQWDTKLAVGLTAPFLLSRLCVPLLKRSSSSTPGCIINISSTRAKQAEDDHEAYSAVKAGLLGLTQSMAISLGHRHNIRVNALSLGWIHVGNENVDADARGAKWEDDLAEVDHKWHPAGRVGQVEDVLKAVLFLVESGFVTGEEIVLDGGVTKKMVYPEE
ncbi:3-oxoacyl-reductase [Exidia glandulosa HHB12029]|uniref:3-oxoacyl-reductase n=1 Tax=Exidia glandulosa HHB12029 TaxID=1314781 RepID=A0A165M561_EXIGL|nr:3-oxoacyl-reductase [Exidia glandulosa HHB12029]